MTFFLLDISMTSHSQITSMTFLLFAISMTAHFLTTSTTPPTC
jgi:hypothetical protein